jgi:hypothetical protein
MLLASYRVVPVLAPMVRVGFVSNHPDEGASGQSFVNPVLGVTYAPKLPAPLRLALFFGVALPLGTGGGRDPDPEVAQANAPAGVLARSALDNAMFAVNYLTVFPGLGLAVVAGGFTVQVEATLLQLTQVRGQEPLDDSNTNFTTGLHAGYFVFPFLSVGAELRHQRWITTPAAVGADPSRATRDNTTLAFGPRVHVRVGEAVLRPGIALVLPLDDVMADAEYKIVQLDLLLTF